MSGTKTKGKRFDYIPTSEDTSTKRQTKAGNELTSVARGDGRMEQDREQLNVRIPAMLKRRAVSKAVLEGMTIGEVIEKLLLEYIA